MSTMTKGCRKTALGHVCCGFSHWSTALTLPHSREVGGTGRRELREAFGVFATDLVIQMGTVPQRTHTISQPKLSSPGTEKLYKTSWESCPQSISPQPKKMTYTFKLGSDQNTTIMGWILQKRQSKLNPKALAREEKIGQS